MNKRPQELDARLTRTLLNSDQSLTGSTFFLNHELGVLHDSPLPFQAFRQVDSPFVISDYRFGVVLSGEARSMVNLREHRLTAGVMALICPGAIAQPQGLSADFRVKGMALFRAFPLPLARSVMADVLGCRQPFLILHPDATDFDVACRLMDAVWDVVNLHYDQNVVAGLVSAVFSHWHGVYLSHCEAMQPVATRSQEIFERFIRLVNVHAATQHRMGFYADRLCLTERYLSTVVHQASGVTAKEWIDRAIVMDIKLKLRHTTLTLKQIADETAFPNPSFFNKFFRRMTGITPQDFRRGKQ